jgi:hypothetical protein
MTADRSRRAILARALLVPKTIALGASTTLAASPESIPPLHRGAWPIHSGRNVQPTENDLRALHLLQTE